MNNLLIYIAIGHILSGWIVYVLTLRTRNIKFNFFNTIMFTLFGYMAMIFLLWNIFLWSIGRAVWQVKK